MILDFLMSRLKLSGWFVVWLVVVYFTIRVATASFLYTRHSFFKKVIEHGKNKARKKA